MPFKNHQLEYKKEHVINIQHRFCGIVFIPNSKDVLVYFDYSCLFQFDDTKKNKNTWVVYVHYPPSKSKHVWQSFVLFFVFLGGHLLNTKQQIDVSSKLNRHLMLGF